MYAGIMFNMLLLLLIISLGRRLCVLPSETKSNAGEFLYEENPEWRQYE